MMIYLVIAVIGLTLGLYAGKRRAKGEDWCQILCDLGYDCWDATHAVWACVTNPFRAEPAGEATDGQDA